MLLVLGVNRLLDDDPPLDMNNISQMPGWTDYAKNANGTIDLVQRLFAHPFHPDLFASEGQRLHSSIMPWEVTLEPLDELEAILAWAGYPLTRIDQMVSEIKRNLVRHGKSEADGSQPPLSSVAPRLTVASSSHVHNAGPSSSPIGRTNAMATIINAQNTYNLFDALDAFSFDMRTAFELMTTIKSSERAPHVARLCVDFLCDTWDYTPVNGPDKTTHARPIAAMLVYKLREDWLPDDNTKAEIAKRCLMALRNSDPRGLYEVVDFLSPAVLHHHQEAPFRALFRKMIEDRHFGEYGSGRERAYMIDWYTHLQEMYSHLREREGTILQASDASYLLDYYRGALATGDVNLKGQVERLMTRLLPAVAKVDTDLVRLIKSELAG